MIYTVKQSHRGQKELEDCIWCIVEQKQFDYSHCFKNKIFWRYRTDYLISKTVCIKIQCFKINIFKNVNCISFLLSFKYIVWVLVLSQCQLMHVYIQRVRNLKCIENKKKHMVSYFVQLRFTCLQNVQFIQCINI